MTDLMKGPGSKKKKGCQHFEQASYPVCEGRRRGFESVLPYGLTSLPS
jgi:hypothetical protein